MGVGIGVGVGVGGVVVVVIAVAAVAEEQRKKSITVVFFDAGHQDMRSETLFQPCRFFSLRSNTERHTVKLGSNGFSQADV